MSITYQAIKYVRLSHADETDSESNSIINQKRFIEDFAEKNPDIEIVAEKVDDGYTGIIFDRPAFKEMMDDIYEGKANCVIVKDLSRLGRDYVETGRYLRTIFPTLGVRFIAINDNIDTAKDASGDDLGVTLKTIMNDAYSRDISMKTRSALAGKRRSGDFTGACAVYGYCKSREGDKNILIIDEYAASVVQDIFRMRLDGMSAAKIADELNSIGVLSPIEYKKNKGLPHPTGGFADRENAKWSATTIIRILKDETYTGVLIQGKQTRRNYKIREIVDRAVKDWIRVENTHEAIIRQHDFDLAQKLMRIDTRTAPDEKTVYLFSGILVCGCCGSRMMRKTVPYKERQYFYYWCPTGKKYGCTASNMIKESELSDCVFSSLRAHINNIVSMEEIIDGINEAHINRTLVKKHNEQISENENQLVRYNDLKAGLYDDMAEGIIGKDEHRRYKDRYIAEINRLELANERLKNEIENLIYNKSERLKWIEHFKRFAGMNGIDRTAIVHLIQSISIFDKTTLQITFNYSEEYQAAQDIIEKEKIIERTAV